MQKRRTFLTAVACAPITLLAGCTALASRGSENTPTVTETASMQTDEPTPESAVSAHIGQASQALEDAQALLAAVQLVRDGHVYFDPETVIPFEDTSVTELTDAARSSLRTAEELAQTSEIRSTIAELQVISTILDERATAIPLVDTVLSSAGPYNTSVNDGSWADALTQAETAMNAARDGWKHIATASEAAAGLGTISTVDGFETEREQQELRILDDAFTALGAIYLGFYHTSYGMLWLEAAFQVGEEGEPEAAAEAMGNAVESLTYALSAINQALENDELVYRQEAQAHFCSAEAIAYAADQFRQAYEATGSENEGQAQTFAGKAINALEEAECDVAYEEHALELAREKATF